MVNCTRDEEDESLEKTRSGSSSEQEEGKDTN